MPNINLIQNTTGVEPKPKEKKTPPPSFTNPPPEENIPEPNPAKKLSPLGTFFGKPQPAAPSESAAKPAKSSVQPEKIHVNPPRKFTDPVRAIPAEHRRSWLGGVLSFIKPQNKITEDRIEKTIPPKPGSLNGPALKSNPARGTKILEEKVMSKRAGETGSGRAEDTHASQSWLGVNLIPDDMIDNLEPRKKLITYMIVLFISAAIIGGGYGGLVWYENRIYDQANQTTLEIDQINGKISALRPEQQKAVLFRSQTDAISSIMNRHIYWTKFFTQLEKYTMPAVEYQAFSGSFTPGTNPTFTISATTDSFDSVSQQILAFREAVANGDFISVALIDSGNKITNPENNQESIQFTIQITTLEKVFYQLASGQAVTNQQ